MGQSKTKIKVKVKGLKPVYKALAAYHERQGFRRKWLTGDPDYIVSIEDALQAAETKIMEITQALSSSSESVDTKIPRNLILPLTDQEIQSIVGEKDQASQVTEDQVRLRNWYLLSAFHEFYEKASRIIGSVSEAVGKELGRNDKMSASIEALVSIRYQVESFTPNRKMLFEILNTMAKGESKDVIVSQRRGVGDQTIRKLSFRLSFDDFAPLIKVLAWENRQQLTPQAAAYALSLAKSIDCVNACIVPEPPDSLAKEKSKSLKENMFMLHVYALRKLQQCELTLTEDQQKSLAVYLPQNCEDAPLGIHAIIIALADNQLLTQDRLDHLVHLANMGRTYHEFMPGSLVKRVVGNEAKFREFLVALMELQRFMGSLQEDVVSRGGLSKLRCICAVIDASQHELDTSKNRAKEDELQSDLVSLFTTAIQNTSTSDVVSWRSVQLSNDVVDKLSKLNDPAGVIAVLRYHSNLLLVSPEPGWLTSWQLEQLFENYEAISSVISNRDRSLGKFDLIDYMNTHYPASKAGPQSFEGAIRMTLHGSNTGMPSGPDPSSNPNPNPNPNGNRS